MSRDFRKFHNALRILNSIDLADLLAADVFPQHDDGNLNTAGVITTWAVFKQNPVVWLLRASDEHADRLWKLIEDRQPDDLKGDPSVELDVIKAALADPTSVRVNLLRGSIAKPDDLIFMHDTNGPYEILRKQAEDLEKKALYAVNILFAAHQDSSGEVKRRIDMARRMLMGQIRDEEEKTDVAQR